MVRIAILVIVLVVAGYGAFAAYTAFKGPKQKKSATAETKVALPVASPSGTPVVMLEQAKIDPQLSTGNQLASNSEFYQVGRVVKQGVVVETKDANVKVVRADGGVTLIGTDYGAPTGEVVEAAGIISGEKSVETVMLRDGRVFRLGKECSEGIVTSIDRNKITVTRPDGGEHLLTYSRYVLRPAPAKAEEVVVETVKSERVASSKP